MYGTGEVYTLGVCIKCAPMDQDRGEPPGITYRRELAANAPTETERSNL